MDESVCTQFVYAVMLADVVRGFGILFLGRKVLPFQFQPLCLNGWETEGREWKWSLDEKSFNFD